MYGLARARILEHVRRSSPILGLLLVLSGLVVLVPASGSAYDGHGVVGTRAEQPRQGLDPRRTRGLFVDPVMKAANAGPAFRALGGRAQPLWITDYYSEPGKAAKGYVRRAEQARKTPLLVVYNIPDRDCGMYSSQDDQVTDTQYRTFVTQVANGIRGSKPIVVLEPDAIPFMGNPSCTGRGNRLALLAFATRTLTKAGAWVYLDAGHSGWQTPAHMAPLLKAAGIARARGLATNVANSRTDAAETAYAKAMINQLRRLRVTGVHYVRDTSRNGAGANGPANGDVCNPLKARIGAAPRLVFKGAYDGNLWVKLPGESDGPCNGGPSSGEFFPTGACRLLRGESAYYDSSALACRS